MGWRLRRSSRIGLGPFEATPPLNWFTHQRQQLRRYKVPTLQPKITIFCGGIKADHIWWRISVSFGVNLFCGLSRVKVMWSWCEQGRYSGRVYSSFPPNTLYWHRTPFLPQHINSCISSYFGAKLWEFPLSVQISVTLSKMARECVLLTL